MSVRFTKKSFVSAPTRSVNTPCFVPPWLVPSTRMPPTRAVISQAVSPSSCARSSSSSSGGDNVVLLQPVAKAVSQGFQHLERLDIGLFLGGIAAARCKVDRHLDARGLGRLLDTDIAGQHDHIGHAGTGLRGDFFDTPPAPWPGVPVHCLPSPFAEPAGYAHRWRRRACRNHGKCVRCPRRCDTMSLTPRPLAVIFAFTAATS